MNEIADLLKSLGAKLATYIAPGTADADKRQKEVLDSIRTGYHDTLWQPIANVGFAAGRSSRDDEVKTLNDRVTVLDGEKTRLTGEVATLSDKNKDVAAVQREAAQKIADAEAEVKKVRAESRTAVEKAVRDRDVATYEGLLVAKGVHADNAKAQGILFRERMTYDKDGVLTVMQEGSENIPYTAHGQELLKIVADTTAKRLPATMFVSKVDTGADTTGDNASGGGTGGGDVYAQIREEEKKRAEGRAPVDVVGAYGSGGRFVARPGAPQATR